MEANDRQAMRAALRAEIKPLYETLRRLNVTGIDELVGEHQLRQWFQGQLYARVDVAQDCLRSILWVLDNFDKPKEAAKPADPAAEQEVKS